MFGSEVLDAAAIGAGAALLGGIVAGIFSLIAIRMNHKAERSKIAFEKQIDAFSLIVEAITAIEDQRYRIISAYKVAIERNNKELEKNSLARLVNYADDILISISGLYRLLAKNSIYIPRYMYGEIHKYSSGLFSKEEITEVNIVDYIQNKCSKHPESRVVAIMKEYIGLK